MEPILFLSGDVGAFCFHIEQKIQVLLEHMALNSAHLSENFYDSCKDLVYRVQIKSPENPLDLKTEVPLPDPDRPGFSK